MIDIRRHNAAFCQECFLHHCREQVRRAIHEFDMFDPGDRVLGAVSGGKDSLALWDLLLALDYDADLRKRGPRFELLEHARVDFGGGLEE